jgi:hypothetical protein
VKLNSVKPEAMREKMLAEYHVADEKFDGYNVNRVHYTVEAIPRVPGDQYPETYVLSALGTKLVGPSDHRYAYRDSAEIVAKIRNLSITPPRERGVYADAGSAAKAWSALSGVYVGGAGGHIYLRGLNGRPVGESVSHGWHGIASRLMREGKIQAAGFGRYRIAADELDHFKVTE